MGRPRYGDGTRRGRGRSVTPRLECTSKAIMDTRRFLVTAGNTRERIDRVRDWGNIFTGNTGYRIARALSEVGDVDLLTSNRVPLAELVGDARIAGSPFTSHAELRGAISALI